MYNQANYDELKRTKLESQERFYVRLFASRDDGSYSIDKRSLHSNLTDKSRLPKISLKKAPSFVSAFCNLETDIFSVMDEIE